MKHFFTFLFIGILYLTLSGCLEVKSKITMNSDGSGTVEETVLMSKETASFFYEFMAIFQDPDSVKEIELFTEDSFIKQAATMGDGVTFFSREKINNDKMEGVKVIYKFKDINNLLIDQNPSVRSPIEADAEPIENKQTIGFSYKKGNPSTLKIINNSKEFESKVKNNEEHETSPEIAERLKEIMNDLKFSLTIEFPKSISETNATFRDGNTITLFDIDFGKIVQNQEKWEKFMDLPEGDFESLKKIMKDLPGIKIDLNKEIVVKF